MKSKRQVDLMFDGDGEFSIRPNQVVKLVIYKKDGIELITCTAVEYETEITFQEIYAGKELGDRFITIKTNDINYTSYNDSGTTAKHFHVFEDKDSYSRQQGEELDKAYIDEQVEKTTWIIYDEENPKI